MKVGELKDIENSDNLKQAVIDGFPVVVNKNDVKECFKLKTVAFLQKEAKSIDSGEVDIEMADSYS